jgi:hypothetical protein
MIKKIKKLIRMQDKGYRNQSSGIRGQGSDCRSQRSQILKIVVYNEKYYPEYA